MKIAALIAICAAFAADLPVRAAPALWSGLEPGTYSVGYRARTEIDSSRAAFDKQVLGRTVGIQVWYPAAPSAEPPMRFDRYVLDEYGLTDREATADERRAAIAAFTATLNPDLREPVRIERLISMPTSARRDAPFAPGTFPLVLYFHNGAASKSAQCEYLASHGFVVVSTAVAGTFERDLDVGLTGAETQARDLELAAGWAAANLPVDRLSAGVVGMSFGGISELIYAARHPEVRAIVSLDGGAGSLSGAALVQESPYFETARVHAPMLVLYSPEGADLRFLESLRYSERTFARFPSLHHGDFSGSGFFRAAASSGSDDPSAAARQAMNGLMLRFLRAHLAGDREDAKRLDDPAASKSPAFDLTRRSALPAPPTFEEWKAMLRTGDFASVTKTCDRLKERDAAPISPETFRKLGSWLFDEGRSEDARWLFQLQVSMYPKSARAQFFLAVACQRLDDKRAAREHFTATLDLLPTDFEVDPPTRLRLETTARESLVSLGSAA
jgi:dienelactone hydrolase